MDDPAAVRKQLQDISQQNDQLAKQRDKVQKDLMETTKNR
jgi:hypothetical protein